MARHAGDSSKELHIQILVEMTVDLGQDPPQADLVSKPFRHLVQIVRLQKTVTDLTNPAELRPVHPGKQRRRVSLRHSNRNGR